MLSENKLEPMVDHPLKHLTEDQCWALLRAHEFGRLALSAGGGEVDIFPVNFVAHEGKIYFRTAPGQKLSQVVISRRAAFEIDELVDGVARSVVVHGYASWLTSEQDIAQVEALNLKTYLSLSKTNWVEIEPTSITGREFEIGQPS